MLVAAILAGARKVLGGGRAGGRVFLGVLGSVPARGRGGAGIWPFGHTQAPVSWPHGLLGVAPANSRCRSEQAHQAGWYLPEGQGMHVPLSQGGFCLLQLVLDMA